jgi:glycosyltransferase involved in cell wall biosynthesis
MIVKNEEKHLATCLSSVKDVVDEIIVVDTGSNDKTVEIAESFGAKVFHFDWIDDFSAARNYSLSKCTGDWILYLDADEELNKDSINELRAKINDKPAAINCTVKSIGTEFMNGSCMKYPRLFVKHPGIEFNGRVHEQNLDSLIKCNIPQIDSEIEIIHYGYSADEETIKQKKERNLSLLLSDENKQTNYYDKIKLIQTLASLDMLKEAEKRIHKLLLDSTITSKQKSMILFSLASIKFKQNDLKSALDNALKAYYNLKDNAELNYLLYIIYLRAENFREADKYLVKSIELNKDLLNRQKSFESKNILNQTDLYLRAIYLCIRLNNQSRTKKLINSLAVELSNEKHLDLDVLLFSLTALLIDKDINKFDGELLKSIFTRMHLNTIVGILKNCRDNNAFLNSLTALKNIFPNSATIYKNLALFYLESNSEKAIALFIKSLEFENDPSVLIHLISIYISQNNVEKVVEVFNELQEKHYANIQIKDKIDILKKKLSPILNSVSILS